VQKLSNKKRPQLDEQKANCSIALFDEAKSTHASELPETALQSSLVDLSIANRQKSLPKVVPPGAGSDQELARKGSRRAAEVTHELKCIKRTRVFLPSSE